MRHGAAFFLLFSLGCFDKSVHGEVHAEGNAGRWDLYPVDCAADQNGTQAVTLPGGGAVPNVRVVQTGTDDTIVVTASPPAAPIVLQANVCRTFDIDAHLSRHHGSRSSSEFVTVDGYLEFDCSVDGNHFTGSLTFQDCR